MPLYRKHNDHPQPSRDIFDPYNSSSTGHQRSENRFAASALWRDSRNLKLHQQFTKGTGGGRVKNGLSNRTRHGQRDIRDAFNARPLGVKKNVDNYMKAGKNEVIHQPPKTILCEVEAEPNVSRQGHWTPGKENILQDETKSSSSSVKRSKIFQNLCFYINGCTLPAVSDHRLRYLIVEHGGTMSISFGRKSVTHVIVGNANAKTKSGTVSGAGGGLAAGKIQKEIMSRACKVKYVNAEWILKSIEAGKRVSESRFSQTCLVSKNQPGIEFWFKPRNAQ